MTSVSQIIRRRRQRKLRRQANSQRNLLGGLALALTVMIGFILPAIAVFGIAGSIYAHSIQYLPDPIQTISMDLNSSATELYDRNGETLLYSIQPPPGQDRRWTQLTELPEILAQATLLATNSRFPDIRQFNSARAITQIWSYILGDESPPDQSISGYLVHNTILPSIQDNTVNQSLLQISLTAEINRLYSPQEILEWYLNTNYYGHNAFGIEAAAQVYLGKSASDLSLDEAALLVAIPSEPQLNPFDHEEIARNRQADLLRDLFANQLITQQELTQALSVHTTLRPDYIQNSRVAPEFSAYARRQAEDILSWLGMDGVRMVSRGGLRITTTLDLDLYYQSECVLRAQLNYLNNQTDEARTLNNQPCAGAGYLTLPDNIDRSAAPDEGSVVIMDARTGEIKSLVGAAEVVARQPGSLLHPFVYFEGFRSAEFTPASLVLDVEQAFPGVADGLIYTPANLDGKYYGPLNLRDAMVSGLLTPAVTVADQRGLDQALATAHRIGLNSLNEAQYDLSLLERGGAVSLLDMSYAYSVFASLGVMHGIDTEPLAPGYRTRNPVAILRIENNRGDILWEYNENQLALNQTPIFDAGLGYLINHILSDHSRRQSVLGIDDETLQLSRPVAVISNSTGDKRDSWTIGYTPQLVIGTHFSRSDKSAMSVDPYSLKATAPVWQALMSYAHERDNIAPKNWERPENITEQVVCERSGLIPHPSHDCPQRTEIFLAAFSPTQMDTYWRTIEIDSQTGQLATANTPSSLREKKVYFNPPQSARVWWEENALPLAPTTYSTLSNNLSQTVQILQPQNFAYVTGSTQIQASLNSSDIQSYQISYGRGLNPTQWIPIGAIQTEAPLKDYRVIWDTTGLDGIYTLRLTTIYANLNIEEDYVQITIDNFPPEIDLQIERPAEQPLHLSENRTVILSAEVTDNLAIDRVEFYRNGSLLGTDKEWPYGFEYRVNEAGKEMFEAVAYDQVGNSSRASIEIDIED